jgi:hypothetical protein
LNSSITFQPGNVLSNIGNKLYFAGQELTDASGGGQNWSAFPALQDVSMNNFSLRALSTLQYQDGARLYSQTGNNLFYNGQPISYGPSGNASNWSQFPAKTNITAGQSTLTVGNIQNNGSNITNGNTFTNSLGVGGLSLVPIASITSGGDLSCRNIDVGDSTTSLADVNIYGATALPGDSALYVAGGVQFDGGIVHGFSAGLLPVAGINTGRMEILQAGFNLLHPLVGTLTTGTAMSLAAGGALSLAAGAYIETNTSTIQCINTSQGNKNTTLQTGFLTIDPDLAPTSSIKLFNVLGGGVEIDGGGQGSLLGFSTVRGSNLSSINLDVSTINGIPLAQIQTPSNIFASNITISQSTATNTFYANFATQSTIFANFILCVSSVFNNIAVNNIKIADDITGVTNAPMPLQSRLLNFSTVNSFNVSTTDLWVSSINGATPGGGGGPTVSSFINLTASNATISTLSAVGGLPLNVKGFLQFETPNSINNVVNINLGDQIPTLTLQAQRIVLGAASNTLATSLSTTRLKSAEFFTSSLSTTTFLGCNVTVSTLAAEGGLAIKVNNQLEFIGLGGIDKVATINTNPELVPALLVQASTIQLNTTNVRTQSFSSVGVSTSGLNFSSAVCYASNINFNYPLIIEQDTAGNISTAGVAMKIVGHDFQTGAAQHHLVMGYRAFDGANFITAVWPGQGLEDLTIEGYPVSMNDGTVSTIFGGPTGFAVQTQQRVQLAGDTIITPGILSTPSILVSSINGYDARPALTNNLMLSTMELFAASTTLMYWDSTTTRDNINTSGYDAVVGVNGNYKIGASFQFVSGGATDEVEFFLLKNDAVISQSGGIIELENNAEAVTYVESIESLVNGDKIQIGCYTANSNVFVSTINGNVIQSPACILTMYKVD